MDQRKINEEAIKLARQDVSNLGVLKQMAQDTVHKDRRVTNLILEPQSWWYYDDDVSSSSSLL